MGERSTGNVTAADRSPCHDDAAGAAPGGGGLAALSATRRAFIKGVIASGATIAATSYMFRAGEAMGQPAAPGGHW